MHFVKKCIRVLQCSIQTAAVAYCIVEFGADFVICSGASMEPTIKTRDIVLTEHVSIALRNIQSRGDIVVAKSPSNPLQFVCKRIKAVPGDIQTSGQVVPIGHVWLQGDNEGNSTDSRTYGPVPMGLLRGRAMCRVWPPERIAVFTR
ncbi:mitochondrial inner membrane protease subunit 1-like [Ornithodoros turicata]|uniref:mitochondrial inner membrane protease subunit 1-like n=1 Tax=Ornithodoros turicata TaxID=34597 RepID=UPI00313939DD